MIYLIQNLKNRESIEAYYSFNSLKILNWDFLTLFFFLGIYYYCIDVRIQEKEGDKIRRGE